MLDERARDLLRDALEDALSECREEFRKQFEVLQERLRRNGTIDGSPDYELTTEACIAEARARFDIAWTTARDVMTDLGLPPSDALAEALKAEVDSQVPLDDLQEVLAKKHRLAQNPDAPGSGQARVRCRAQFDAAVGKARKRVATKTGIAVESARRRPDPRVALVAALEVLRQGIEAASVQEAPGKRDALEQVKEAQAELEKPAPDRAKLKTWLSHIPTAIQTASAVKPAYQAVREAITAVWPNVRLPEWP
jgi:hypothetical protein